MHARRQCRNLVKRQIVGVVTDQCELVLLCDHVRDVVRVIRVRACALVRDRWILHLHIVGWLEIYMGHDGLKNRLQLNPLAHGIHPPTSAEGGDPVCLPRCLSTGSRATLRTEWQTNSHWHTSRI